MSNAKKLALAPGSFTAILEKMGVPYTEQSGFYRVEGPEGRRMYVARGKITTTVHLSGFTAEVGTRKLEKSPSKKVEQEMDWPDGLSAIEQLRLFADLVAHMKSLDPVARSVKAKRDPSAAPSPQLIDASLVLDPQPEARAEEEAA